MICLFYRYTHGEHDFSVASYPAYHEKICNLCPYTAFEVHVWRYEQSSVYSHKRRCLDCSYWEYQDHTWKTVVGGYVCTDGRETSLIVPGEMMSLPDDELELYLASLTDEELEAFLASLPEDQLDRVTAILPPENDDELLTE